MGLFRRSAFLIIALLAMTFHMFGSSSAALFDRTAPHTLRWQDPVIKVAISTSLIQPNSNIKKDSDVLGAIQNSFAAWEDAADIRFDFEIVDSQSVSPLGNFGDGISLITIAQTPENVLLFSKNPFNEAARTRVFYGRGGAITEADIVLNPFEQFSSDGTYGTFDLQSTLTHEIGHLLGLRHSKVRGATMADSLARNGLFGFSDTRLRTLSHSDISAVRDLYGAGDDDLCCASIEGRLETGTTDVRSPSLVVWAADSVSGQVMGSVEAGDDGRFLLSGLPASDYSVFWQSTDKEGVTTHGDIGEIDLSVSEPKPIIGTVTGTKDPFSINYVGRLGRLTDSAITLRRGEEHQMLIGGIGIDPVTTYIEVYSRFFKVDLLSLETLKFNRGVVGMSVIITVDKDAPTGAYSILATRRDGIRSAMIGAINIE